MNNFLVPLKPFKYFHIMNPDIVKMHAPNTDSTAYHDDEIDLGELFATLWARKFFILVLTSITVSLAAVYAFYVAKPLFGSQSSFVLNQKSGMPNLGNLGGVASLVGFRVGGQGQGATLMDRIMSPGFIGELAEQWELEKDPFFNPALHGPGKRDRLRSLLGISSSDELPPTSEQITASLIATFRKTVTVDVKSNGLIEIKTQHRDPQKAARLANGVVTKVLDDLLLEQRSKDRQQIEYLASELFIAQAKLETAAQDMQAYAIANNLAVTQEFQRASAQLSRIRETVKTLEDYNRIIVFLRQARSQNSQWDDAARKSAFANFPAVHDQEFQSLMGWSSKNTRPNMPTRNTLEKAALQTNQRLERMMQSMTDLEVQAKRDAEAAVELARLQRTIKVQETLYDVLVRQFETHNLSSGFQTDVGDLYEVAVPALTPSAPKVSLILALGLVLGLFLGCGLALILALRSGILHTKNTVSAALNLPLSHQKSLSALKKNSAEAGKLVSSVLNHSNPDLDDFVVTTAGDKVKTIGVYALNQTKTARGAALYVGHKLAKFSGATAVLDLAETIPTKGLKPLERCPPGVTGWHLNDGLTVFKLTSSLDAAFSDKYQPTLSELQTEYSHLLIVFPPLENGLALALASRKHVQKTLIVATPRLCLRENTERMNALLRRMSVTAPLLICD